MPVPSGFGDHGLDFHSTYKGRAFFIETKAPGGHLTARQRLFFEEYKAAGCPCWKVSMQADLIQIEEWFCTILLIE